MADFVHGRTPALHLDSLRLAPFAGWNAPASAPLSLHG